MNYGLLKNEIDSDPLSIGYKELNGSWKSDEVIYDLINKKNIDKYGSVSISNLLIWAGKYNVFTSLKNHRNDPDPIGNICEIGLVLLTATSELHLNDTNVQTLIGVLVSTNILTQTSVDELYVLSVKKVSRADILGLGNVSIEDIGKAGR